MKYSLGMGWCREVEVGSVITKRHTYKEHVSTFNRVYRRACFAIPVPKGRRPTSCEWPEDGEHVKQVTMLQTESIVAKRLEKRTLGIQDICSAIKLPLCGSR